MASLQNQNYLHPGQCQVFNSKTRFRVVCAGRRWGKCHHKQTLIALADGTYKPIEQVLAGDMVLTINETTYQLEAKIVKHVMDNGVKEMLRVVTRSGKKLEITPNHPLLANNIWTEAKDLKLGDMVAVPKMTVFGDREMPQYEIDFLAIWLADGDHGGFTKEIPEIVSIMKAAAFKMGTEFTDYRASSKMRAGLSWRWRGISRGNNGCVDLLKRYDLRDTNAKTKSIPDDIFRLPKHQMARFLNLFVACDGSVNIRSKNTWAMEIGLANEKMVKQLADLFLKFGIRGNISHKIHKAKSSVTGLPFESWRFIVSDSRSLITFCEEIGAVSKEHLVEQALKAARNSKGSCNSYLPIAHDDFIKHLVYTPVDKGAYGGHNAVVARDLPEELRLGLNSWRKQTPTRVSELRYKALSGYTDGFFDPIADGDFAWDEITKIEHAGEGQTYDLEVTDNHNFIAEGVVSHNSALSKVELIRHAGGGPDRRAWYIAPTYSMAKQIMWDDMLQSIPEGWIKNIHITEMWIKLKNGSMIEMRGADNPDRMRGVGLTFAVLDEFQGMKTDVWTKVIRPTLAKTRGGALFIGTPNGFSNLYDVYMLGQNQKMTQWESWQFKTSSSPFIPISEIEQARHDMDAKSYLAEFEASFETMTGRVYYAFDRNLNVRSCPYNPELPIWVGQDFNVDPMSSVIIQPQPSGRLWVVDEIYLRNANTNDVCDELEKRFWRRQQDVILYPDPAGTNRSSARGESDFDVFRERNFRKLKYRRKHPLVTNRVNAVNRQFANAKGERNLFVDSSCKNLIASLEQTLYKPGSKEVDKGAGVEHMADAIGYPIELEFPTRKVSVMGISI